MVERVEGIGLLRGEGAEEALKGAVGVMLADEEPE
jgi:hypothetical protein